MELKITKIVFLILGLFIFKVVVADSYMNKERRLPASHGQVQSIGISQQTK